MNIKSKFSKDDISNILTNYSLGNLKSFKPLNSGGVQTNILLETTKKKLVFRYYNNRSVKYILFEVNLLNHLKHHSFPCAIALKNNKNKHIGKINRKSYVLFEFKEGVHKINLDIKKLITIIAKLHLITAKYKPINYEFRDSYNAKSCLKNAKTNIKKVKNESKANKRINWLKSELKKIDLPRNMPKGVCHCDTHYSNFLFKDNKLNAVLDFDDSSYTFLLYDIANILYYWAWPDKGNINLKRTKGIIKEYEKYRKLSSIEKRHIYDMLKMVIFMSISWFIHDDKDYNNEKRKIEQLNTMGKDKFYDNIFK